MRNARTNWIGTCRFLFPLESSGASLNFADLAERMGAELAGYLPQARLVCRSYCKTVRYPLLFYRNLCNMPIESLLLNIHSLSIRNAVTFIVRYDEYSTWNGVFPVLSIV